MSGRMPWPGLRQRGLLRVAAVLGFAAVAFVGLGSSGCGNCAAICDSSVSATGPLAAPVQAGMGLHVRACLADECGECNATLDRDDDDGGLWASCDGRSVSMEILDEDAVRIRLGVEDGPVPGEVVRVTVTATDSGEVLAEAAQPVQAVVDESKCGYDCSSAEVAWE